ncbi:XRE family transcriptional regulator [Arsenophonus nasoniae]|uniref:XRE family transcriptional regulator n=1 Tax=Arsenophonus nasoniae TaxID=638 RepID=A0AA95GRF7_9GAMM|nr:helix-turn-helix domain-containing protein [Arsenophonus nasoniae]WGM01816.1 XRE family transcriptional regulator [Arsenophonus nasoniae]WGM05942.1 XRE family transcriptional regulator [Arsenophonus nasoniae]WGM10952.1 XRE family transcriptional regulator [Arsenophonus nasoniae]WGM15655.1 XRE family transcriptional regulator [Arsenophonus nasoniae]
MSRCQLARLKGKHKMRILDVIRKIDVSCNTTTLMYEAKSQTFAVNALDKLCILFDYGLNEFLERVSRQ